MDITIHEQAEPMAFTSFESLLVWQKSSDVYGRVHDIRFIPKYRHLQDQLLRSTLSISSNIAEGYERIHIKEVVYFLNVAKGSSGEARSQVLIAGRFGIIELAYANELASEYSEISKMLYGLIQAKMRQGKG
jgi:four helix bundle protein